MDRLDELAIFIAIFDSGSLASAARRLNRSPAAITRALGGLEDRFGCRLFERTTRRLKPTDAGRLLAEQSRRLLADYADLTDHAGAAQVVRGRLRITAPVVFGRRHIMPIVAAFLRHYPDVTIDMVCADGNLDLIDGELDIAVRIGALADSSLVARRVGQVRRMLVASPAYLARYGVPVTLADLADHAVIVTASFPAGREWRLFEEGREKIVRLVPRLTVNQVEAALLAAREGLGIARAQSYQVIEDLAAGHLVRVLPHAEPPPAPVHLLVPAGRHRPARVRVFLDFAAAALAQIPALVQEDPGEGA